MKRCMDLFISIPLITILSPLMLIIALCIKAVMGSPILFKQKRPGLDGKPFLLFKFRTMKNLNQKNDREDDENRLTELGKKLRKYSLDELPQLINVVKGDMSLIGPRPLLMEYLPLYNEEQSRRHDVKPGITGWAQVNGRNNISWDEKFQFDKWYVENQSLLLDCRILWMTVFKVLKREGINQQEAATMEKFNGTKEVFK
ncbi:sugar transferase [Virgibacillus oceani]